MKVLTKKYRLLYDKDGYIRNDYKQDCGKSKTYTHDDIEVAESDNYEDIEKMIRENKLKEIEHPEISNSELIDADFYNQTEVKPEPSKDELKIQIEELLRKAKELEKLINGIQ